LEESIALTRDLGSRRELALSLHELACVHLMMGEPGRAAELEQEALTLSREDQAQWGIAESLEGLAAVAASGGQHERAARLLGAADAQREAINAPRPVPEESEHLRIVDALTRALGQDAFRGAWQRGRTMARMLAIEDALMAAVQMRGDHPPTA
jgi:hypothetical protein